MDREEEKTLIIKKGGSSEPRVFGVADRPRRVVVEEGAAVRVILISDSADARLETEIVVEKAASVGISEFVFGSAGSRIAIRLAGEGAAAVAGITYLLGAGESADLGLEAVHDAPRTRSELSVRGALSGDAKVVNRGLIRIGRGAAGSEGRERQDALVLSGRPAVETVPELEISDDDVKCGHAASVGRLDEEKLFYLMSRGLSREKASSECARGFFAPAFEDLPDELKNMLAETLSNRLSLYTYDA